jgi:hypothetical protein
MRHTTTDLLHYARERITDRIAEAADTGASLPLDLLQCYLAFQMLDRLESMDVSIIAIIEMGCKTPSIYGGDISPFLVLGG